MKGIVNSISTNTENLLAEMVARNPSMLYEISDKSFKLPNPM
jgi:hypothetical protein